MTNLKSKLLSTNVVFLLISIISWNTSTFITRNVLTNFIINFFLLSFLLFFFKIERKLIIQLSFFLFFVFFNVLLHFSNGFNFFLSQINHFIQIPIYVLFFLTFFKIYKLSYFNFINKNAFVFTLLFLLTILMFKLKFDIYFYEFNLFMVVLLLAFSPLFKDSKLQNKYFLFLIILLIFLSSRISFIGSILFFASLYFYQKNIYIQLLRCLALILLIYPFLTIFFVNEDVLKIILNLDHNTYFRLQSLTLSGDLIRSDYFSIIFGKGFGYPFRDSISSDLSFLHHFNSIESLNIIPNHNSIYDFFYRFGLVGLLPLIYIIFKFLFLKQKYNAYSNSINILTFFIIFQISFNPWVEDQNQLIMFSFLISLIISLYKDGKKNVTNS